MIVRSTCLSSVSLGSFGRLAQLGERLPYKQEVTGSSPVPPIAQPSRFTVPPRSSWLADGEANGECRRVGSPAATAVPEIASSRAPLTVESENT
jgi:hypothetical protein